MFSLALILPIVFISFVHAEVSDVPGVPDFMQGQNIEDLNANLNANKLAEEFNKAMLDFREFLQSAPVINFLVKLWDFVKPVFGFILGVEAEMNWTFLFAVLVFVALLYFSITIFINVLPFSDVTSVIMAIGIILAFSILGFTGKIAVFLAGITTNIYTILIIALVLIALIIILKLAGKQLRKQKEKLKEKMNKQKLESSAKVAEAFAKGITK